MIVIDYPGDPQGKGRARFRVIRTKAGGSFASAYTPAKTRSYESGLATAAKAAMGNRKPLDGPLAVTVFANMPVPQSWSQKKKAAALAGIARPTTKPDADNIIKMLDALNKIVWLDDKQVVDARIIKFYSETPGLKIEVETAGITSFGLLARGGVAA